MNTARLALWLILLPSVGFAQESGNLEGVIINMRDVSSQMSGRIAMAATSLLLALAAIEFAWTFAKESIQGGGLNQILVKLFTRLIVIGFFIFVIRMGDDLVALAIETASVIASMSPEAVDPSPDGMLADVLTLIGELLDDMSFFEPGRAFGIIMVCIGVAIAAAVGVAFLIVAYAELYLMAVATMIALGFGALEASRDIAIGYLKMILGKCFKLMTVQIVFGIIFGVVNSALDTSGDLIALLQILMIQIIGVFLMIQLPSAAESITGSAGGTSAAALLGGGAGMIAFKAGKVATRTGSGAAYGAASGAIGSVRAAAANADVSGGAQYAGAALAGGAKGGAVGAARGLAMSEGATTRLQQDVAQFLGDRKK
ncbi:type IV secretion system protein [Roseobacter sp. HKCCA0434]|uniref:type IV secretion system protein n=1 Tax=Roseobacter sp. HKCCA0434 TaxID=3079297 RepID=UPI002905B6A8|nr:type IV secretion system protein [Roseobacter sp. HKCCA0434]